MINTKFYIRVEQDKRVGYLCHPKHSVYQSFDSDPITDELVSYDTREAAFRQLKDLYFDDGGKKLIVFGPHHWIDDKGGKIRLQVVEFSPETVEEIIIENHQE